MKKLLFVLALILSVFTVVSCGKKDKEITVYTRDTTSGTRDGFFTSIGFKDAIKDNSKLVSSYVERASNQEVISAVKNDKYGIGYISLASLEDSGLKGLTYEGVVPSEANVINKTYSLTRNFNYIVRNTFKDEKTTKIVEAYLAFIKTRDALETIASKDGIIEGIETAPTWDSIKASYPICNEDNSSVTIRFGGSTSVQKISEALSAEFKTLCGGFTPDHNHTGSGDAYKRTQGSEKDGSDYLDVAFLSREFNDTEAHESTTSGKICTDAIVVVVNNSNKVSAITKSAIKSIYDGTITKWSEVE